MRIDQDRRKKRNAMSEEYTKGEEKRGEEISLTSNLRPSVKIKTTFPDFFNCIFPILDPLFTSSCPRELLSKVTVKKIKKIKKNKKKQK